MTRNQILAIRVTLVGLAGAVTWLSLWPSGIQVGPSDKLDHLAAYFTLALFTDFAFPRSEFRFPKGASLVLYGMAMETLQRYVPGRYFELLDIVANTMGVLLYVAIVPLLKRLPVLRTRWKSH